MDMNHWVPFFQIDETLKGFAILLFKAGFTFVFPSENVVFREN